MPHKGLRLIYQNEQFENALLTEATRLTNAGSHDAAVSLLTRLVDAGETIANCYLGMIYECGGFDVSTNYDFAHFYYKKAAEDGWADGHIGLGRIYYYGLGIDQDLVSAFERFERIDQAGVSNPIADFYLGQMLYLGEGVEQNIERARLFLNRSSKCGYVWSQYQLASIEKFEKNYFRWLKLRILVLVKTFIFPIKYGINTWHIGLPTCTMVPAKECQSGPIGSNTGAS